MRKLIRGGTVVSATHASPSDVLVDGEEIVAVGALGDVDAEVIDADGCYVLPGLIDNHTHMAMPFGGTHSIDDYDTGTRAAAAGGTTCIVDFVIQQHPDGLRSSLEEWKGRAEGAAHVDYGFHIAITQADEGTFADMEPMVEEGICTFKVFLAYRGVLMVTDDLFLRVLERTRDLGALTMVHCENGWAIDVLVERALAAGNTDPIHHAHTRPEALEAEATHRSVRLAELAGAGVYIVHVTCGLAADEIATGQARGVAVSGETCLQYLTNTIHDLERPDFEGARYVCSPPLREEHNQELLWKALDRGVLESVSTDHCPFNSEQKALGRDDFSKIPNGLAMIQHRLVKLWDLGVEGGRITPSELVDITSTAIARRFGLERKGAVAPGKDADLVIFDPATPFEFSTRTSHMNVDYDLFEGESSTGSVRQTFCRGALVYDRGEIVSAAGTRALRAALAGGARRGGHVNADRVLADLRELAELTGGPDGARRVCWTDEWVRAREFLRSRLDELPVEVSVDPAGNLWAELEGDQEGFVLVGSHVDSVPAGGWLDGALGILGAVEVLRSQAEAGQPAVGVRLVDWADEEGARFGRSLFGSSACAGTLDVDEVRDLRDREGERLEDVLARHDVDLARVHESGTRLRGARAYLELHIEQGPVLESRGEPAATVLGTCGVERHTVVFTGQAAHAGATPMGLRRDSFAATAQAALAIREVGFRHDGVCTVGGATSQPGVVTAVAGRTDMLLDQRHLDPDVLAAMLEERARGLPRGRRGARLRGRARAPLVDPPDPVRRPADRPGARARWWRPGARTRPSRAGRFTTPPRWRG